MKHPQSWPKQWFSPHLLPFERRFRATGSGLSIYLKGLKEGGGIWLGDDVFSLQTSLSPWPNQTALTSVGVFLSCLSLSFCVHHH